MKIYYILIFFLFSCNAYQSGSDQLQVSNKSDVPTACGEYKKLLQNGDLILRTDDDMVSASLRNFSKKDKTYSHCGFAFYEDSCWMVYHLMAGDENPSEEIKKERIEDFIDPHMKTGFGIFRYMLSEEERASLQEKVHIFYKKKVRFDTKFDLRSDDKMYCAEMIYKALKQATKDRIVLPITERENYHSKKMMNTDTFVRRLQYVALDNLYINAYCTEIKRFHYTNNSLEKYP